MINSHKKAFTLVELMIVIAIIGILAAALFPSLTGYLTRSRDTARLAQVKYIISGNELFRTDIGRYANPVSDTSCWGWDTPIDGVFIPELANYSKFRDPDKSISYMSGSMQCGWIQYYRYPAGAGGCSVTRGSFYVIITQRVLSGSTWDNPGFSCTSNDWINSEQRPGLASPIVFGKALDQKILDKN